LEWILTQHVTGRCWFEDPTSRPTFAKIRGTVNMLLLVDASVLREKVAAATNIAGSMSAFEWEVPAHGLQMLGEAPAESCGRMFFRGSGSGSMMAAMQTTPPLAVASSATAAAAGGGGGGAGGGGHADARSSRNVLVMQASAADEARDLRRVFAAVRELRHPQVVELLGCNSAAGFMGLFRRPAFGTLAAALSLPPPPPPSPPQGSGDASRSTASSSTTGPPARPPIPLQQRAQIALHVALGLEYIHAHNFVHGCVSPHTVYLDEHHNARVVARPTFHPNLLSSPRVVFGSSARSRCRPIGKVCAAI
jgi:hypothetical protein